MPNRRASTTHSRSAKHFTKNAYAYYDVLRISPSSNQKQIKSAYIKMAKANHPDLFWDKSPRERRMAELRFKLINEAYTNLKKAQPKPRQAFVKAKASNDNQGNNNWLSSMKDTWLNMKEIFWPIASAEHTQSNRASHR